MSYRVSDLPDLAYQRRFLVQRHGKSQRWPPRLPVLAANVGIAGAGVRFRHSDTARLPRPPVACVLSHSPSCREEASFVDSANLGSGKIAAT